MTARLALVTALLLLLILPGCSRRVPAPSRPDDASVVDVVEIPVRVPAALAVARAIDALSVSIDPASLALTHVTARAGSVLGVEADTLVFRQGELDARPVLESRTARPTTDFDAFSRTWTTPRDGVPAPGTKYVVEMQLVLFQTDVPPARSWDPRGGRFEALWTRTLRQAEE